MSRFTSNTIIIGSILMGLAVILGAFGAHALADKLSEEQLDSYKTGVLYQFIHSLAILFLGTLSFHLPESKLRWVVLLFGIGIVFFSGSIYLLSTSAMTGIPRGFLGPITPIGGLLFIFGWVTLVFSITRK